MGGIVAIARGVWWLLCRVGDVIVVGYRVRKMLANDLPHLEENLLATRRMIREHIAYCRGVRDAGQECRQTESGEPS